MSSIFDDITLTWQGKEYVIPANSVLKAIAKIEEVITVQELVRYTERDTAPLSKLAQAFASVLRMAGARVSDDEVYAGMFRNADQDSSIPLAVNTLLGMMIPRDLNLGVTSAPVGKSPPTAANSSKPVTKSRSDKAGSLPRSSGH